LAPDRDRSVGRIAARCVTLTLIATSGPRLKLSIASDAMRPR
jgi:hypothetical protein